MATATSGGCHRRYRDKEVFRRVGDKEVKSDKVPEIVDEDRWQRVHEKREESKERSRNPKPDQHGRLSGVLFCGHCGYSLDKAKRSNKARDPYTYYSCQSGARYPGKCECHQWRVLEKDILPLILDKLFDGIDTEIREMEFDPTPSPIENGRAERLAEQLKEIEAAIKTANRRFLKAASLSPQMEADYRELVQEYESQKRQIEQSIRRHEISGPTRTEIKEGLRALRSMFCIGFTEDDEILISAPNAAGKGSMTVQFKKGSPDREPLFFVPIVGHDEIRSFLKQLGVKVFIYWQPRARKDKRGNILRDESGEIVRSRRNFEVERIHLQASFRPEQFLNIGTSRRSRAGIHGRD